MKKHLFFILTVFVSVSVFFFSACKKDPKNICVNDIKLDIHSLSLEIGDTARLTAIVYPDNAEDHTVTWTSSNPEVAIISNDGLVTAVSCGETMIVVTTEDGKKTDECIVFVFRSLRIVQWCDPQLGYQIDYATCVAQAKRAVELINMLSPDLLLLCGDMIHDCENEQYVNDFLEIISHVDVPMMLTPGNHDLPNPVTIEGLERYRSLFGDDFQIKELKGYFIISLNSQLYYYPNNVPHEEYNRHVTRVNEALQDAKSKNKPVIVMSHEIPLNMPDVHKYFIENGAFLWLGGHWHIPWRYTYSYPFGSIITLVGETTGCNSDNSPLGIRLLTFHPDHSFDWDFVPLY